MRGASSIVLALSVGVAAALEIETVSTRHDMVTGGDVLVRVSGASDPADASVDAGGTDVTDDFSIEGGALLGLVKGLPVGTTTIRATEGPTQTSLEITNHAITGPVFSGPHQTPYICETEAAGLGPPLDEDCSAATKFEWFYRSAVAAAFLPLSNPYAPYPPDTATVTTNEGKMAPYVVRVESGTINRAIFRIAVLDDPHARGAEAPFVMSDAWNRGLAYRFGGGCGTGYHQGEAPLRPVDPEVSTMNVLSEVHLGRGFAVGTSSLNVLGNACNDVLSSETLMMVKEHFTERYGVPVATIGMGASGGAIQQYMMATAYPGLLDGLVPIGMYPDVPTTALDVYDCRLLVRALNADPIRWSEPKRAAVAGHQSSVLCIEWDAVIGPTIAASECPAVIPPEMVYDPEANPDGARCTLQDSLRNIYGTDPETGFGRRWYDNVGVQYGLEALEAGTITKDDFLALNASIGGFDIDGNFISSRTPGDLDAIRIAYETGRVVSGAGGLDQVPILDLSGYLGQVVEEAHDRVRPYTLRARLAATAPIVLDHHVMWVGSGPAVVLPGDSSIPEEAQGPPAHATDLVDEWLSGVRADASSDPLPVKVTNARPEEAIDRCIIFYGLSVPERADYEAMNLCNTLFPIHGSPRQAAGGPLAHDILKCQLKPLDPTDYAVTFTAGEWAELEAIFPDGVCDWSKPSVNQVPISGTWLSFGDGG